MHVAATATLRPNQPKLVWRAGEDGVEHAFAKAPGVTRTLCGAPIVAERLAWPKKTRHETCDLLSKGCTWSEIRALHGDV